MASVISAAHRVGASFFDNPVVRKDLRTRMRGRRAFATIGGYALLLTAVLGVAMYTMWANYVADGTMKPNSTFGKDLFLLLNGLQTVLLTLFIPVMSAGALSREVELRTMDSLVLTRLSSAKIVLGKQMAAFLHAMVLLGCSLPFAGMCILLGGISPAEVIVTYLLVALWAFVLSSFGVLMSGVFRKTGHATLVAFVMSLGYYLQTSGLGIASMFVLRTRMVSSYMERLPPIGMLTANPTWVSLGALSNVKLMGVACPLALLQAISGLLLGLIFLLLAATHVKYRKVESALAVRLLLIGRTVFSAFVALWAYGNYGRAGLSNSYYVAAVMSSLSMSMLPMVVVLSVGEIRKRTGSVLRYAFSWRRMFKRDVGGALGFLWLWTAISITLIALALHLAAGTGKSWIYEAGLLAGYTKSALVVLAVLFAAYSLGVFLSCVFKRRMAAIGVFAIPVAVASVVNYLFPPAAWLMSSGMGTVASPALGWFVNSSAAAALWPPVAVVLTFATKANGRLPWWSDEAWMICSGAYIALGIVLLLMASPVLARTGGISEEDY